MAPGDTSGQAGGRAVGVTKRKPSEYFLGAILRGFDAESSAHPGRPVTASGIWDRICMECAPRLGAFEAMFAWDSRKGSVNRIGTIQETVAAGLVPGLVAGVDARGRPIVVAKGAACRRD